MSKKWYSVSCTGEIGSYIVSDGETNFPRGVFLAYRDCCLTTGISSREEAEKCIKRFPCTKLSQNKKEI